ncbi:MAG: hypothetical protein GY696_36410, partial [Gammaproteobacteria bacterium]|nr:hypothetical protein [Gammaproteobacteria bacterium]
MRNNAVVAASNQLLGALLLARSEAVKREAPVTVTFPATADGWVVTDADGNTLLSHTVNNAAIEVTATGNAGGGIIFGSDGRSSVRYQSSDDYLKISYQESKRQICLSASGRPWIESGGSCS